MIIKADLHVPVDPIPGLETGLTCAVRVCANDHPSMESPACVAFCYPGGGYSQEYFDLQIPGLPDYSMAEELAGHGLVVVACDHLGVGCSSHPSEPERLRPEHLALANSRALRTIVRGLALGELIAGLPALPDLVLIGIGHSMGGGILAIQQARHQDFDGIVTMGWSAIHTPSSRTLSKPEARTVDVDHGPVPLRSSRHPGYHFVERGPVQDYWYYWDDVPSSVVDADYAAAVEAPPCANWMNRPGIVAQEASKITVPVHIVMGERDLRLATSDEPSVYQSSAAVSVFMLRRSGHCHNLATTRKEGWLDILRWVGGLRQADHARRIHRVSSEEI